MIKTTQGIATESLHKAMYLAKRYEGKTMGELVNMFQLPALEMNAALWLAEDLGYIEVEDADKPSPAKTYKVLDMPEKLELGEDIKIIKATVLFCLGHLAKKETDVVEPFMLEWMAGYPSHDSMIALNELINEKKIATYQIEDTSVETEELEEGEGEEVKNTYTYYTLYKNLGKHWGKKQHPDQTKITVIETVDGDAQQ